MIEAIGEVAIYGAALEEMHNYFLSNSARNCILSLSERKLFTQKKRDFGICRPAIRFQSKKTIFFVALQYRFNLLQMDIWDKQKRSEVMSKIRSKDTKPEIKLRKGFHAQGFRYRINYKKLPGSPDIVFPKYMTAIFVNGCFWHGHDNCKLSHIPKSNVDFWQNKIQKNKLRDKNIKYLLISSGWKVIVVWECEIKTKLKLKRTVDKIANWFRRLEEPARKQLVRVQVYDEFDSDVKLVAEDRIVYSKKEQY